MLPSQASVLYVLKRFPRLSETFILNEMLGLEASSIRIGVESLLPAESGPSHSSLGMLAATVRYLPKAPTLRTVLRHHLPLLAARPLLWVRLALAARSRGEWCLFLQGGMVAHRARDYTNIHAHFATSAAVVAGYAGTLSARPVTVTAHAKDIFHVDNAPLLSHRLARASTVVTVSRFNERHLRSVLPGKEVVHIPNGVAAEAVVGPREGGPVLAVARLVPKKGLDVLIDAVALLHSGGADLPVEIIGDGPLAEDLQRQVEQLDLGSLVRFRGALPHELVDEAYQRCSMVVLPCRIDSNGDRDGLPTVLVEAMARGLPVISTNLVGIPELVQDERTGLVVPPDEPKALAAAILRLFNDPPGATQLGEAGRHAVAERFSPSTSTMELIKVFREARCA
ncbi:MAG: glycosyltransferase [Acidimicrobiia bacterium]|nr:glycosyltransferase [Acidimicrobiia bacterium]